MTDWVRGHDEYGDTVYGEPSGRFGISSYGNGEFGISEDGAFRYWAESLVEAKLAADVLAAGLDPKTHNTRTSFTRCSVPPRGSWTNVHSWRCSCGERSSGGLTGDLARSGAREHRIKAFREMLS